MNLVYYAPLFLFLFVCVILTLLVLMQKGRGGGLASAFGGMGGGSAFGAKTGDVLTWATSIVFGIFLTLAVILNLVANHQNARRVVVGAPTADTSAADTSASEAPQPTPPAVVPPLPEATTTTSPAVPFFIAPPAVPTTQSQ